MNFPQPEPPEPLTEHEKNLVLVKSYPPEPTGWYYLLAAITFFGGVWLGFIYLFKDGQDNKLFGIRALISGMLLPVLVTSIIAYSQYQQKRAFAPLPQQPGVILPE